MSRFARSHSEPVRTWAPPESPLRIEYSPALLREIRIPSTAEDAFGLLYGVRHGNTIRLVATRGRAGLDPLGTFAARVRGEVFMTEEDMERFEKADACVALVLSADTGGFFVRDSSGSLEAVRSYQEFLINGPAPVQAPVRVVKRRVSWVWSLALIPLLYFVPRHSAPQLAVTLSEDEGQVRISWNVPVTGNIDILDGDDRTSIPSAPGLSTLTYVRHTGDVTVAIGSERARFVGRPVQATELDQERARIKDLRTKLVSLHAAHAAGQSRIAALERRLQ
jgi:hypothetical protein